MLTQTKGSLTLQLTESQKRCETLEVDLESSKDMCLDLESAASLAKKNFEKMELRYTTLNGQYKKTLEEFKELKEKLEMQGAELNVRSLQWKQQGDNFLLIKNENEKLESRCKELERKLKYASSKLESREIRDIGYLKITRDTFSIRNRILRDKLLVMSRTTKCLGPLFFQFAPFPPSFPIRCFTHFLDSERHSRFIGPSGNQVMVILGASRDPIITY